MRNLFTEKDLLNYLMTSDFNEELTKEEYKFLLLKYRNFYRIAYSKYQHSKNVIENIIKDVDKKNEEIKDINNQLSQIKEELQIEKNRKLTWRERISGKKIKLKNV